MEKQRYPLDTAGLLFPATARDDWRNMYRFSAELIDPVDPDILQQAVDDMAARFPTFFVALDSTRFQYCLRPCDERLEVRPDSPHPLMLMSEAEARTNCLRVLYGSNTVAAEFFHVVSDGSGSSVFFYNLLARYIALRYAIEVPADTTIKDLNELPRPSEMVDDLPKYAGEVVGLPHDTPSYTPKGTRNSNGLLHVTTGVVDTESMLAAAHRHKVTVTSFLSAAMVRAVMDLQDLETPRKKQKRVNVTVPVNLRGLFESETLRNFVMVLNPGIDPRLGDYRFEEICASIHHQIQLGSTAQNMAAMMASVLRIRKSLAFRVTPVTLKNVIFNIVFELRGENLGCMSLSNLNKVKLPAQTEPYIEHVDFILGPPRMSPYNCAIVSYGGKTRINITRNICEDRLERHFFSHLKAQGVAADVTCDGVPLQLL